MNESPRKRRGPLFGVLVLILLTTLAVEAYLLLRPKQPQRPPEAQRAILENEGQKAEVFGDSSAPIGVRLYAPLALDWHQKTIGLLREYDDEYPGRIQVRLMPMGDPACDEEMHDEGYACATILINGESTFTLPDGRTVTLEKKPNTATSSYNSEDVIAILDRLAEEL